jgi:hypothetical protein
MKKISLTVIILLIVFISVAYIFIPGKLIVSSASKFHANRESVYRFLVNTGNWEKWWPGTISKNSSDSPLLKFNNKSFQVEKILYDRIQLKRAENNDSSKIFLTVIPFGTDSMGVEISSEFNTSLNPISRLSEYFQARKFKRDFDTIVSSLQKYASNLKNMYGIEIKKELVQYQNILSDKKTFSHYPTTEDIYLIISELRNYVNESGAKELFSPMLNIEKIDSTTYTAQVGLPVDKVLPPKDNMTTKWMMKGGNILSADVKGGRKQIDEALKQMDMYTRDYQRTIIAIPFQMLITDRTKEPDSTKWITRIYYPVV